MLHQSHHTSRFNVYSGRLQKVANESKMKEDLKRYRPNDEMRFGYESMASLNLLISEFGLTDYLIALSRYEDNLNGVDTRSEH